MRKEKSTIGRRNKKKSIIESNILIPKHGELPSDFADRLGLHYASKVTALSKKTNGQYFTPVALARFMASLHVNPNKESIKILDPGCGIGILSTAMCEELANDINLKVIELIAFEIDLDILPLTEKCIRYLAQWLRGRGIELTYFLCKNDFILHNSPVLNNYGKNIEAYDIVISNPPYFKLQKKDERAIAAKKVIHGQTNIYSIFLLIATCLVHENGQLIFITPRSFCSGNYFRLFREVFFSKVSLSKVHLFDSRNNAFKRDKVLQENIIIVASHVNDNMKIVLSASNTVDDINERRIKEYCLTDLVNMDSYQKVLHLPSSDLDEKVIDIFKSWSGSLRLYGLDISTGPVVDFRNSDTIRSKKLYKTVPLYWLHNVNTMSLSWPKKNGNRGKEKGQYILQDETSKGRLVENKNYVLVRRFSTKDDARRLVAAPYLRDSSSKFKKIGIENHLNYIYHRSRELGKSEALGIAALINSRLFDMYFRTFNGNINVSATELRDFPLPDFQLIRNLGERIEASNIQDPNRIDGLVTDIFNLKMDLFDIYE
jgi:adenine-specific DNA-methyltransferase